MKDALVSEFEAHQDVILVPVGNWANFIPALNELVLVAASQQYEFILFQSVEASASEQLVEILQSHLTDGRIWNSISFNGKG